MHIRRSKGDGRETDWYAGLAFLGAAPFSRVKCLPWVLERMVT